MFVFKVRLPPYKKFCKPQPEPKLLPHRPHTFSPQHTPFSFPIPSAQTCSHLLAYYSVSLPLPLAPSSYVVCGRSGRLSCISRPFLGQITSPTASTTFNGGQSAQVTWMDDGHAPTLQAFGDASISIYAGNAQQQVMHDRYLFARQYG